MNKKPVFLLLGMVLVTVGVVVFIMKSNDHRECEERTERAVDLQGNITITKKHICNEPYHL